MQKWLFPRYGAGVVVVNQRTILRRWQVADVTVGENFTVYVANTGATQAIAKIQRFWNHIGNHHAGQNARKIRRINFAAAGYDPIIVFFAGPAVEHGSQVFCIKP
ncbi:hypothetical protein SMD27_09050 [Dongia soli]|uniref:Uncharacterized protein n=1 Tax=Dongia soli TaxID=600628 RepID=A0ABU5EAH2_9PROT|nr:hypothetical protein [Dongia soli]MDY0882990.1 hypothetical protein [Dongia soli]